MSTKISTVKVTGVDIFVGNNELFAAEVINTINGNSDSAGNGGAAELGANRKVSATSAHGLVFASKNPDFKNTLDHFYYNLPDGMPIVWVGRLKGHRHMQRCSGVDMFEVVMKATASHNNIKHFFCGGKEGVAKQLQASSAKNLGNSNVVGTYSPPFRIMTDEEFAALGQEINNSGANIVWIGLSTPKQEVFAASLAKHCTVDYIITVGAVFDFFTGNLERAPRWIQNIGLEWFYRLLKEPRRLFSRYFEVVPGFIALNLKELFAKK
jgi:N-acetylglucosaminyldiphosphoundecaprenol N-acetyl-beta-D-mannosaminyltransferase